MISKKRKPRITPDHISQGLHYGWLLGRPVLYAGEAAGVAALGECPNPPPQHLSRASRRQHVYKRDLTYFSS
jgi:hypothetical protein